jgi:hypothetical protein
MRVIQRIPLPLSPPRAALVRLAALAALSALMGASGCVSLGVKPWQRDLLSREEMAPTSEALDRRLDERVYTCKEASSGGRVFAGGAYGCP